MVYIILVTIAVIIVANLLDRRLLLRSLRSHANSCKFCRDSYSFLKSSQDVLSYLNKIKVLRWYTVDKKTGDILAYVNGQRWKIKKAGSIILPTRDRVSLKVELKFRMLVYYFCMKGYGRKIDEES